RAYFAMKLIASGVTASAASTISPSFSRSSSSTRITMRPAERSSMASSIRDRGRDSVPGIFTSFSNSFFHGFLNDFGHPVELEIAKSALFELSQIRPLERVRNQHHFELARSDIDVVQGQADAIDRDTPLFQQKAVGHGELGVVRYAALEGKGDKLTV